MRLGYKPIFFISFRKPVAERLGIVVGMDDSHFRIAAVRFGRLPISVRRPKVLNSLPARDAVAFDRLRKFVCHFHKFNYLRMRQQLLRHVVLHVEH